MQSKIFQIKKNTIQSAYDCSNFDTCKIEKKKKKKKKTSGNVLEILLIKTDMLKLRLFSYARSGYWMVIWNV